MSLAAKEEARAEAWRYFSRSAAAVESGVEMVKVLLAREVVGERDRRETRRRLLGKRKGKKDKDAFRRNQPPTTIHQDNKTRPEKGPGHCEGWENSSTVHTKG